MTNKEQKFIKNTLDVIKTILDEESCISSLNQKPDIIYSEIEKRSINTPLLFIQDVKECYKPYTELYFDKMLDNLGLVVSNSYLFIKSIDNELSADFSQ